LVHLAQAIYQEQQLLSDSDTLRWFLRRREQAIYPWRQLPSSYLDPARLAVLADAVEAAGCTNLDILDHLRGPGPHVRGCWGVDLLLGKG
jgi:hypothetical protein